MRLSRTHSLPDGATPVDDDEAAGLIPTFVATRADLNLVEQVGIAAARTWAIRSPTIRTVESILSEPFVRQLHRRMYGTVWRWAGTYRSSERNIGVDPVKIPVAVRDLVANARCWIAPDVTWITPELACVRVHHQMVAIHPFPNGNGRHARMMADAVRAQYLAALRAADKNDFADLLPFVRS